MSYEMQSPIRYPMSTVSNCSYSQNKGESNWLCCRTKKWLEDKKMVHAYINYPRSSACTRHIPSNFFTPIKQKEYRSKKSQTEMLPLHRCRRGYPSSPMDDQERVRVFHPQQENSRLCNSNPADDGNENHNCHGLNLEKRRDRRNPSLAAVTTHLRVFSSSTVSSASRIDTYESCQSEKTMYISDMSNDIYKSGGYDCYENRRDGSLGCQHDRLHKVGSYKRGNSIRHDHQKNEESLPLISNLRVGSRSRIGHRNYSRDCSRESKLSPQQNCKSRKNSEIRPNGSGHRSTSRKSPKSRINATGNRFGSKERSISMNKLDRESVGYKCNKSRERIGSNNTRGFGFKKEFRRKSRSKSSNSRCNRHPASKLILPIGINKGESRVTNIDKSNVKSYSKGNNFDSIENPENTRKGIEFGVSRVNNDIKGSDECKRCKGLIILIDYLLEERSKLTSEVEYLRLSIMGQVIGESKVKLEEKSDYVRGGMNPDRAQICRFNELKTSVTDDRTGDKWKVSEGEMNNLNLAGLKSETVGITEHDLMNRREKGTRMDGNNILYQGTMKSNGNDKSADIYEMSKSGNNLEVGMSNLGRDNLVTQGTNSSRLGLESIDTSNYRSNPNRGIPTTQPPILPNPML